MSQYVPAELKQQVREHFADCCAYCRSAEALTVTIFEMEHIKPSSAGGDTSFENLSLACPTCNRFKSDRMSATDPETQEEVSLFHPHDDRWIDHFEWSEDKTTIIGLSPTARATIDLLRMNRPQVVRVRRMWVAMNEHPPAEL